MTTIVAVQGGGDVTFAWDSQATWGSRALEANGKVFCNSGIVFGVSGSARVADVFRFADIPFADSHHPDFDPLRYLTTVVVPSLISSLQRVDAVEGGEFTASSDAILSFAGEAYYLSSDMAITRDAGGVYYVGSGGSYAAGALEAGASAKRAMKIASKLDLYTGGAITVRKASDF